jgi:hypothetical protein
MKPGAGKKFHNGSRKQESSVSSGRAHLLAVVQSYFDSLAMNDLSAVPWAEQATLRVPLNPEGGATVPIVGRDAIIASFSNPLLPAVEEVEVIRHVVEGNSVCTQVVVCLSGMPVQLRAVICFRIEGEKIVEQEHFYDPRPALQGVEPAASDSSRQQRVNDVAQGAAATGYSLQFDFSEAFQDALAKLSSMSGVTKPHTGRRFEVSSIGTITGGTAPERGLYVAIVEVAP